MNKNLLSYLLLFIAFVSSYGQTDTSISRYIYLGGSMLSYKGDLSSSYAKFTSGVQLGIKFNKKRRLNGSFQIGIGKVVGQNYNYQIPENATGTPSSYFESSIFSFSYDLIFNLIRKENINVYVSQGVGIMRFNTKDEFGSKLIDKLNTRSRNETYNSVTLILPTTLGFIYHFPRNIHLGLGLSWLRPNTDYVDNISKLSISSTKDNILALRMSIYIPFNHFPVQLKHHPKQPIKNERTIIISE